MAHKDDLEHHLADRLADARDFADFGASRRAASAGTPEGQEVTREIEVAGAEHLGGRKVQDTFKRTGKAAVVHQADEPGRKKKLEHHLASRLKEVQDEMVSSESDRALRAYQEMRRKMGGG